MPGNLVTIAKTWIDIGKKVIIMLGTSKANRIYSPILKFTEDDHFLLIFWGISVNS